MYRQQWVAATSNTMHDELVQQMASLNRAKAAGAMSLLPGATPAYVLLARIGRIPKEEVAAEFVIDIFSCPLSSTHIVARSHGSLPSQL